MVKKDWGIAVSPVDNAYPNTTWSTIYLNKRQWYDILNVASAREDKWAQQKQDTGAFCIGFLNGHYRKITGFDKICNIPSMLLLFFHLIKF